MMILYSVPASTLERFCREHPEATNVLGYIDPAHEDPHWFTPSIRAQQKLARLRTAVTQAEAALVAAKTAETAYHQALYAKDFERTVVKPARHSGRARLALLAATDWESSIAALNTADRWDTDEPPPWPAFRDLGDVIAIGTCPDPTTYRITLKFLWSQTLNDEDTWDDRLESPAYQARNTAVYTEWDRKSAHWINTVQEPWEKTSQASTFTLKPFTLPSDKGIVCGLRVEWTWAQAHRTPVQAAITTWIARLTAFAQTGLRP